MPEGTITDWATASTDVRFELPLPVSLPATIDGQPLERRKVARPLREEERVDETLFWNGSGRLAGKVAIISGGNPEVRQAMAMMFSREGADIAIIFQPEEEEGARALVRQIEISGKRAMAIVGDVTDTVFCSMATKMVAAEFGKIDLMITSLRSYN